MHDKSPYALKGIDHLSASAIKDYSNCEALGAYRRNFIGVPTVPLGIFFAFGIVAHKINEMMCRHFWSVISRERRTVTTAEIKRWVNYSRVYIQNVMDEKWGTRGKNQEIIPLAWMSSTRKASLAPAEFDLEVKQRKSELLAKMINAVSAVGAEFTNPIPYSDMQFEVEFSSKNILLGMPLGNFPPVKLDGQIDRIQFYPDGTYEVLDYKSGSIFEKYDRSYLVEDVQMTIYDYVAERIFGFKPKGLYIQSLNIATKDRKDYGAAVLSQRKYRKKVPPRVQAHSDDLALLAGDIFQMIEMVVNRHTFSETECRQWQPDSPYGRKAGLAETVAEGYFKPRIGEWCKTCPFFELCPSDHPLDWEKAEYASELLDQSPEPQKVTAEPPPEYQTALFDYQAVRSKNKSKHKSEVRDEMIATGKFVPLKTLQKNKRRGTATGLLPFINRLRDLMLEQGTCPCIEQKVLPWLIVGRLMDLYKGQISLKQFLHECPNESCPRKRKEEKVS